MFGTFQEEKDDEEIVYGLVDQVKSFNPLYLEVCKISFIEKYHKAYELSPKGWLRVEHI